MPTPETVAPTQTTQTAQAAQALAVLDQVRGALNPETRLFADHRRDLAAALSASGADLTGPVGEAIEATLRTAAAYEGDGMFAVMPTWALLRNRVARAAGVAGVAGL